MKMSKKMAGRIHVLSGMLSLYEKPIWPILDRCGLLLKKKLIVRLKNGMKFNIRTRTSDFSVINELLIRNVYSPILRKRSAADKMVGVDIGAHIGVFSVLAANNFKNARILSFEPVPQNFHLLQKNIELNGLVNRVVPIHKAVSKEAGAVNIFKKANDTGGGSLYLNLKESCSTEKIPAEAITLSDIFDLYHLSTIDFLKLDCEGAEYEIICSTHERYLRRISEIILEYHSHTHCHGEKDKMKTYLKETGFDVQEITRYALIYARRI